MIRNGGFITLVICICAFPSILVALPKSFEVSSGDVSFSNPDQNTLVVEASDHSIIQTQDFSIAEGERVYCIQPTTSSSLLARVTGENPSAILGRLESNGRFFLVNPNGIYFGPHAEVNMGSLIASTFDCADADFLQDRFAFFAVKGKEDSQIVNQGFISACEGGCAFISQVIRNEGTVVAVASKIIFAAGEKVTLDFTGEGLISFTVEGSVEKAMIEQVGTLESVQGQVHLAMSSVAQVVQNVINFDGIAVGDQIVEENGVIYLVDGSKVQAQVIEVSAKEGSLIQVEGLLDASNPLGMGGTIHVLGERILLKGQIESSGASGGGEILVGGAFQGEGDLFTAKQVVVSPNAEIINNATLEGNGGRVVIWADETALFDGRIFSKGGPKGGDGGFVETSGYLRLGVRTGKVDTSASLGKSGVWLLDPLSITVVTGGVDSPILGQLASCSDITSIYSIDPTVITGALSNVILCASADLGSITISDAISMTTAGVGLTLTVDSLSGIITLNNDITTKGGVVTLEGPVTLGGSGTRTIDTTNATTTGANIVFTGPVDGAKNFTLLGGTDGEVVFEQIIGGSTPLGAVTVSSGVNLYLQANIVTAAGVVLIAPSLVLQGNTKIDTTATGTSPLGASVTLNGAVNGGYKLIVDGGTTGTVTVGLGADIGETSALSVVQMSGAGIVIGGNITTDGGTIRFDGPVSILGDLVLTDTGPTGILFFGSVDSSGASHSLTLTAPRGAVSFFDEVGGILNLDNLTISAESIQIQNDITINSDFVMNGPVELFGDVAIESSNINFANTVNGSYDLSLDVGSSGAITVDNVIGNISRLNKVTFVNAGDISAVGIYAESIIQIAGGSSVFNEFLDTTGIEGIDLSGEDFRLGEGIRTQNGGGVAIEHTGLLEITSTIAASVTGTFLQTGSGVVHLSGAITTQNKDITFVGPVVLTGTTSLSTGSVGAGNITFTSVLDGEFSLSLALGVGNLEFMEDVGSSTPLGDILIVSARNVDAKDISALSITQEAGFGHGRYLGNITTTGSLGINIFSFYLSLAGRTADKILTTTNGNIILNSVYSSINTALNPVEVSIDEGLGSLFVGASYLGYFSSLGSNVMWLGSVRSNIPASVTYNGVVYRPTDKPILVP